MLSQERWQDLLDPFLPVATSVSRADLTSKLSTYLELILRWNAKINLTAIRDPEEIVRRHFGESLFAGWHLASVGSLLDLGSGAGFPGLPIQILHPGLDVTLAESHVRKAAFLREAVRVLELPTVVWPRRAEELPSEPGYDMVTLRAVDRMSDAVRVALPFCTHRLCVLAGPELLELAKHELVYWQLNFCQFPLSSKRLLLLADRDTSVPRGTRA